MLYIGSEAQRQHAAGSVIWTRRADLSATAGLSCLHNDRPVVVSGIGNYAAEWTDFLLNKWEYHNAMLIADKK